MAVEDIIIIGAGLSGGGAAFHAAQRGRKVALPDMEGPQSLGRPAWWSFGGRCMVGTPKQRRLAFRVPVANMPPCLTEGPRHMPNRRPKLSPPPPDAQARRDIAPVVCYPPDTLPEPPNLGPATPTSAPDTSHAQPREAATFRARAGQTIRITSVDGPQVGDLNLWNANDLTECFFSGKTRALHGTHVTTGDILWSNLPYLRPMATITHDSLDWYGIDDFGGAVHDVIGTRCDPYTNALLNSGDQYHHCCHSNLTRALADATGLALHEAELHVHDVLNVFMCTGFTRNTGQYFMKASPVRPGDMLEFRAEFDLLGALSACPGGNCGAEHSSDTTPCFPLMIEVFDTAHTASHRTPANNPYDRSHGR